MIPEPTILEMLQMGAVAIRGSADKTADFVRGSDYESLLGPCAVIWSRQAQRDTDLFNAVNFHTADGDDLTQMALKRYGKVRLLDARGTGTATLVRPTSGTADTIYAGTRLLLIGSTSKTYRVTADTDVLGATTSVVVPIEAVDIGPGSAATIVDPAGLKVRVDDRLRDTRWKVTALTCSEGTIFEQADVFRTRIRTERRAERVGQNQAIIDACVDAGAVNVVLFRSDYAGPAYDHGLNVVYVGDANFVGSAALVKACTLALRDIRIAGVHLQVFPMAAATVAINANVYLVEAPGRYDIDRMRAFHTAAIRQYMNGETGTFSYAVSGIRGAIILRSPEVGRVDILSPTADAAVVSGAMKNFVSPLKRYSISSITLNYFGL